MEEKNSRAIEQPISEREDSESYALFETTEESSCNASAGGSTTESQARYCTEDFQGNSPSPVLQDRSDELGRTPDQYSQQARGRFFPSPYTANTERARLFNGYVRGLVETKLDILVPISHQPQELVQEIISDTSKLFPEFASCTRKRIRTYLKSYRRSKRVKDLQSTSVPSPPKASECTSISSSGTQHRTSKEVPVYKDAAVATINADPPTPPDEDKPPDLKIPRIVTHSATISTTELLAVKQLIQGYRESALFLTRAADQLEQMLTKEEKNTT